MNVSRFTATIRIPRLRHRLAKCLSLLLLAPAMLISNIPAFGQTLTTIYNFGSRSGDGAGPGSGVILDKAGNLFGATGVGGVAGSNGIIFELSPPAVAGDPWTETIVHRFFGGLDGKNPESRPIMTSRGALLGTTSRGGVDNLGMAYVLTHPNAQGPWVERPIYNYGITPNDIMQPLSGLIPTSTGLFGADQGGANNIGAVYELTPSPDGTTWIQNILYSFGSAGNAAFPSGEPVRDTAGNLYGVTAQGGVNGFGAVYEVSPPAVEGDPWTEILLHSFDGTHGSLPAGPLLLGAGGVLYGTASSGGANDAGSVFQLTPPAAPGQGWTFKVIHDFSVGDGNSPSNGVIADKKGRLFGTAAGTIFMLQPPPVPGGTWKEVVLHSFAVSDGFLARSPLTLGRGALYGTSPQGGTFGAGTVFQLTIP